jgi:dihydroneopterin aldolase
VGIVRIGDLPVEVRIGALPEERVSPQTVHVDLEIRTDMDAASSSDRLADAVNYIEVADLVRSVARGSSCYLIETLAHRMLTALSGLRGVEGVRVRVRKHQLPGMAGARFVEVEQEWGAS